MPGDFLQDDLDGFFSDGEFGDVATIGAGPDTINGILDVEYVEVEKIQGLRPVFTVKSSDVEQYALKEDVQLTIGGDVYVIKVPDSEGTGVHRLIMLGPGV
jgi:hypothetical protein